MIFREKKIKKRLEDLLNKTSINSNIPVYRLDEMREFLIQNEYVILFEVLCESIYEFSNELSAKDYDDILILTNEGMLKIEENRYLFLEKLVR